jgi:hypothetical protein
VRCYFLKQGHIAAVEPVFGLSDDEAVEKCREMFAARKDEAQYEGFEVWDLARMIIQCPPPSTKSEDGG